MKRNVSGLPTQALPVTPNPVVVLIKNYSSKVIHKIKSKLKENNITIDKQCTGEKLWAT